MTLTLHPGVSECGTIKIQQDQGHWAHWMKKLIYSIKSVLSSDQINELGLPAGTIEILSTGKGILEFITFMVYCYGGLLVHSQLPMCVKLISVMDNFIKQNSFNVCNESFWNPHVLPDKVNV